MGKTHRERKRGHGYMRDTGQQEQPGLFDGARLRDNGMARAERGACQDWLGRARSAIQDLAIEGLAFTTDDVWAKVGPPASGDKRALGSLIRKAARDGLIQRAGYRPSARPECHARPVAIWRGA